ncbi:MAG: TonB-dependent receptor [Bacteroidales bacterium]|nr:TonB-dependent receptor [Bacteroidales bacterium]
MKKTRNYFWLLKPNVNFHKLLLTMKIVTILLFCGLALPAYSLTAEKPSGNDLSGSVADQQQIRVTGTVTDASTGEVMPGVNIQVKGTAIGAISDGSGKFSISTTDQNATLVFSFVGYADQEIPLAGKNVIDVALKAEITGLEEVVVVGYGTQKRANVVGAVTSIPGTSIQSIPAASVSNAISGRLPGSVVIQQSGEPGNLATRILIRGRTNLGTSTYPLVVIDGIIGRSMDDIDPMDIESLSVLKDASAAIYGAQAANGVILITTKRGKEGTPRLNYQFYQGFMTPTIIPKTTNAYQYATMVTEYQVYESKTRQYSDKDIELYRTHADPWEHPDSDWYGDLIKNWTTNFKHALTLDGGYKGVLYYFSLGLRGDESFYAQSSTNYKQYNVRAKLDIPVTTWLKTGFEFAGIQNDRTYPRNSASSIVGQATRLMPTQWSFWPDGKPGPDIEYGDNPVVTSTFKTGKDEQKTYQLQNTFRINITPPFIKGLSLNGQFNYDVQNFYRHRFFQPWLLYFPIWSSAVRDPSTGFITSMDLTPTPRGLSSPENHENYDRTIRKTINLDIQYQKKFGDHSIGFFGGFEQYSSDNNNFYGYRKYYVSTKIQTLDAGGDAEKQTTGGMSIYARKSYIARATYDYKGKYLAEAVFRADGSLKFPPEGRWGYFPGLLLGWRASEEDFWKNNIPFINFFKLRASYGQMGMDPGSSFQYINKFALTQGNTFGTGTAIEIVTYPSVVANPDITWEKQTTQNIGFDSKLMNDLLHLNVEIFFNKREDILTARDASVPNFTGLSLPEENIARVDNKGFEFDAGIHKSFATDFRVDVSGNFSWNRNEVVFMDEPERAVPWQVRTGHPFGATLLYNYLGVFADNTFTVNGIANYPHWNTAKAGDLIFEDVSGDGKITGDDRILLDGTDAPEIFYGASLDATWKDLTLSVLIQGQGKYMVPNYSDNRRGEAGNYFLWHYTNRWTPDNTITDVARAYNRGDQYWNFDSNRSTYWYDNMAYCRLKNLVLTYNIPSQLYKRFGISKASVYFSGNNLALIWAAQRNFDPEIAQPMNYPAMKTFAVGANISF